MIHSQGREDIKWNGSRAHIHNRRVREACWERKQGKDRKHIQEQHVSWFYQWDSHRSPLLPIPPWGEMPFHATKTLPKKCLTTQVLKAFRKKEKCIPIDAVLMGRLAGSPVTAPLGLFCETGVGTTKGSGGGGGIRILTNEKHTVNIYTTRTHADKNTLEKKWHQLTHLSSFSSPTLEAGSSDSWGAGPSRELLVGWKDIHTQKGLIYQEKQVSHLKT